MQASDRPAFLTALNALAAAHRVDTTEALLEAYWLALEELPLERVRGAVAASIREERYMPKPAELRSRARSDVSLELRATRAWDAVLRAMRDHGDYASVDFDDGLTNATVRHLGGWTQICGLTSEELHRHTRREFERAYRSLAEAPGVLSREAVAPLPGLHAESGSPAPDGRERIPVRVEVGLPPLAVDVGRVPVRVEAPRPVSDAITVLADRWQA